MKRKFSTIGETTSIQSPSSIPTAPEGNHGLAIASLVLGILSLCGSGFVWCGGILRLIGILLGALDIKSTARNVAIAGIALSAIGLILIVILRVVFRSGGYFLERYLQNFLNTRGY